MNTKATVVDVRTPEEFMMGNVPGSINIPLSQVPLCIDEFKAFDGPVVLCCASGGRSGQATMFLRNNGIACENGGSWTEVYRHHQSN